MSDRRDRGRDREPRRGGGAGGSDMPKSLFVRGLADGTRPEDLLAAFNRYGNVKDVYLPKDYYTGEPRGFAYIQYETQEEADLAYNKIEYITVNGEDLKLEWASGSRKRPEQMRARDDKPVSRRSVSPRGDRDSRGGDRHYRPRLRYCDPLSQVLCVK
ncbi:hypothetical protein HK097_009352 [Rhizophlyctis rosea]|uniref:RRM domain-containing protein n=1 Tax=Rhizophlyctis rosea TaxID=64517 RepID=A0AAD5X160_9FUNG|nr:hypothetical protein HK097_009352 [Rhizophlyctis rosea]